MWGPYISEGRTAEHESRAYSAIQKAVALAPAHASPEEQAFINAMKSRYTGKFETERRTASEQQTTAWDQWNVKRSIIRTSHPSLTISS